VGTVRLIEVLAIPDSLHLPVFITQKEDPYYVPVLHGK
jgi:hypothetical protein